MESTTIAWVAGGGLIVASVGLIASSIYDLVWRRRAKKHA
jgi:hypothetical protein